jgi:hypothetical protein
VGGQEVKRFLYPVTVALAIRMALAPFFMHAWDMTTTMLSTEQFLTGVNPYAYVVTQSRLLIQTTGLPVPYYGFAYSATTLLIYAPFYAIYHALGFTASPLTGWQGQPGEVIGLVYPDAFYFLFLIKVPIIVGDAVATYLLYQRSSKAGWAYALSPYGILITSLWGNFDPLVGALLLIAYLAFDRHKGTSGFALGLSMMKIYTVAAAPAFLMKMWNRPRELGSFLLGAAVANIPSIYYMAVDPSSFLYALEFQASRPTNGVNIFYALIEVRSIFIELDLAMVISLLFVVALVIAVVLAWRSRLELGESIMLMLLVYLVFAPVVNEQLLAAILPLGLLTRNFSHKLTVFPLLYVAFNATYFYFAVPLFFQTSGLRALYYGLNNLWGGITGSYIIQARYTIGAALGVSSLLLARSTFEGPLKLKLTLPQGPGGRGTVQK